MEEGKDALEFLKTHYELTDEAIKEYRLGFLKSLEELSAYLQGIGYSKEELQEYSLYDEADSLSATTFSNRIIFPYRDELGNIVALGGRKVNFGDKGVQYQTVKKRDFPVLPMFFGVYEREYGISALFLKLFLGLNLFQHKVKR